MWSNRSLFLRSYSRSVKRLQYRYFRFLSGVNHWGSRRITKAGGLVLAGVVATGVLGLDTTRTMAYQGFTLLAFLLLVSILSGLFFRVPYSIRRVLPRFATVGHPLTYPLFVRNQGSRKQDGLMLLDDMADPRPSFEEFVQASHTLPDRDDNWWERWVGYERWRAMIDAKQMARIEPHALPQLAHDTECEIRATLTPIRRGYLRFTGATLAKPDPFGLFKSLITEDAPGSVLVLPKRYPVPSLDLPGRRMHHLGGVPLAASVGDSEEFVSLREYRSGDPLRRLHWASWAKAGKPFVKEFQAEFFVRHALILDTFQPASNVVFEEAVSVAASFASTLPTQESFLDLMFVGTEAYCLTAGRGVGQTEHLLEVLACVQPGADQSMESLHSLVNQRADLLSGCVCVLLAWDEARQDLVRRLNVLGIPTLVFVVADGEEGSQLPLGPMAGTPERLRRLYVGRIAEGLATI